MNNQDKAKAAVDMLPQFYRTFDNGMQEDMDLHKIIIALETLRPIARGESVIVPAIPNEKMWGNDLVRNIVRWMSGDRATPAILITNLKFVGVAIPEWLASEPEMKSLDHHVTKGTQAVILFRAMIAASQE
jgi:hypothetical protein